MQKSDDWNIGYMTNSKHLTVKRKIRFTVEHVGVAIFSTPYYQNNNHVIPHPGNVNLSILCPPGVGQTQGNLTVSVFQAEILTFVTTSSV